MQLVIYFFLPLVAFNSAIQSKNGPQILSAEPSSSEPPQKNYKRSLTQEFNLYFTPEKVETLQAVKSSFNPDPIDPSKQNSGISEEFYNELIQKYYAENLKPAPIEEPQEEQPRSLPNFFLPREESVYNNKPNYRQLLLDQTKLSGHAQNVPKNKFNQLASPSGTHSGFFNLPSGVNRNEDQRKSEKEIDSFLRHVQIDQFRPFNSPTQVRIEHYGRNVGLKKSAVEKEIENAWRQHQAFKFEQSNSPADISKQSFSLSASDENPGNTEEQKQIIFFIRNGQAYGFERLSAPTEVNNQGSQGRNRDLHNDSEVKRQIEHFWKKHQQSQFQRPFLRNVNKEMSEKDKQTENIFIPQAFVLESPNSPTKVGKQSVSASNEKQERTEEHKQIHYLLRNGQAYGFERTNSPVEVNNLGSQDGNELQKNSEIKREIEMLWRKQQDLQFQRSVFPAEVFNQGLSGWNENKVKSKVEKQIENIFRPKAFGYERLNSPPDVISQSSSNRNKNQDNTKAEKQIKYILRNLEAGNERQKGPKVYDEIPFFTHTDKSNVDKEITF